MKAILQRRMTADEFPAWSDGQPDGHRGGREALFPGAAS
jgi:hypothetical protein